MSWLNGRMGTLCFVACALGCSAPPEPAHAANTEHSESESEADPVDLEPSPADDAPPAPRPALTGTIQIVDAAGAPVPAASAVVIDGYYRRLEGTGAAPLTADDEGRITVSLTDAQLDDALLLVWAPGHASLRFEIDPTGEAQAQLPAATALSGQLVGAHADVEHVWIQAVDSEAAWPFFVRCDVDDDGRFSVRGLEAGGYRVSSRPLGGAPVLAADREGNVRFLAEDPGPVPVLDHRLLDREITAAGQPHAIRVAVGRAMVGGEVVDEAGAPTAGARVRMSSERPGRTATVTDANGHFEASVPPSPNLRIVAEHPDYGAQWTDHEWRGWSTYEAIPDRPVRLVLRRGVVLRGRVLDASGAPRANLTLLMIPAYVGSGPTTLEARTDGQGRFSFERAVLNQFEIVPGSLDAWQPRSWGRAGDHLRVVEQRERWLARAAAGEAVELRLESYTLVATEIRLTGPGGDALAGRQVEVWTRTAPDQYLSQIPRTDGRGRVRVLMERGVPTELWAAEFEEGGVQMAPWTRGIESLWRGTPDGPNRVTLVAPVH